MITFAFDEKLVRITCSKERHDTKIAADNASMHHLAFCSREFWIGLLCLIS